MCLPGLTESFVRVSYQKKIPIQESKDISLYKPSVLPNVRRLKASRFHILRIPSLSRSLDVGRQWLGGFPLLSAVQMISDSSILSFIGSMFLLPAGMYLMLGERKGGGFQSYAIAMSLYFISSIFYSLGGILDCRNVLVPHQGKRQSKSTFAKTERWLALASAGGSLTFLVGTIILRSSQYNTGKQSLGLTFYITSSLSYVVGNILQLKNLQREYLLQKYGVFITPQEEDEMSSSVTYLDDINRKWSGDVDQVHFLKRFSISLSLMGSLLSLIACTVFPSYLFFLSGFLMAVSSVLQVYLNAKFPVACPVLT